MAQLKETRKLFFVFCFIFFTFNSCKKDYPDDIPQWIKTYIYDYKHGKNTTSNIYSVGIDELKNTSGNPIFEFYYYFDGSNRWQEYYDIDNNKLCYVSYGPPCPCSSCGTMLNGYSQNRFIWSSGEKK